MVRQLIIFSFVYFCGAAFSTVLAGDGSELEKSFLLSFAEDASDAEFRIDELLKNQLKFSSNSNPNVAAFSHYHTAFYTDISSALGNKIINGRKRASTVPLFLLFHSFLFYDCN